MNTLIQKLVKKDVSKRDFPIKVGQKVRVAQRIQEGNKERIQNFDGVVIGIHGSDKTMDGTFTVRALVEGVGVEKIFPFYCPTIESIKILGQADVRRAKLYYLRQRSGKSARLRYSELDMMLQDKKEEVPASEAEVAHETDTSAPDGVTTEDPKVETKEEKPEEELKTAADVSAEEAKNVEETAKEEPKSN